MIKFLHTADIHLDSPLRNLALRDKTLQNTVQAATRAVLRKIIDIAIEEEVDAVLLAGDLWDSECRTAQTLAFLSNQLRRLQVAFIPFYYIKGNHDAEAPLLNITEWPDNVHIFSAKGESFELPQKTANGRAIFLHGVSFQGKYAGKSLLPQYPEPQPRALNIGLLHSSVNGAEDHDNYAPCSVAELAAKGYDYWALGHIHKRKIYKAQNPLILMPGCPQGRNMGEDGIKSVSLISVSDDGKFTVEERVLAPVGFFRHRIMLNPQDTDAEIHQKIADGLAEWYAAAQAENIPPNAVIRLMLSGQTALYWQLLRDEDYWQNYVWECCKAQRGMWLDRLELDIMPLPETAAEDAENESLQAQELQNFMKEIAQSAEFQAEAMELLEKLTRKLPPEARGNFGANEVERAARLEKLLAAGQAHIAALLEAQTAGER